MEDSHGSCVHLRMPRSYVLSGVETMYRSLKKQGRLIKEIKFIAFGGGEQALMI